LLFPFHTLRVFNAEDPWYVKADHLSMALSALLGFISVWHMPLLFALAGASTYFALHKRSTRQYLGERLLRLGVPFLFGFLVLIPPQTWLGGRFNSGYSGSYWHYLTSGDFLVYNVKDGGDYYGGFGIGHLWFIMVLLIVAIVVLPLLAWGKSTRGAAFVKGFSRRLAHPAMWLAAALLIMLGEALPDPSGLQTFYYLVFFALGFAAFADDRFMRTAERLRWHALAGGLALSAWWILSTPLRDGLPDPSVERALLALLGTLASWLMIVALLGLGKRYLDRTSPALAYLSEGSYPVYILHQTVIVVAAFSIVSLAAAEPLQWLTLLVVSVAVTFGLYEVVRRFALTRFLFGMRPKRIAARVTAEGAAAAAGRAADGGAATPAEAAASPAGCAADSGAGMPAAAR
jgi:fucose 4-O-acetylase-like acetyltransferase